MKNKTIPATKHKIRVELQYIIEVEVYDKDDMAEVSREVVQKFRTGIMERTIPITEGIVSTEVITK